MKRRMIGAWLALMITASSLVVSASPAADMSSVSADPQQEQTEPEEEEEAPDIPVTDQPGEAEMPVPTACLNRKRWRKLLKKVKIILKIRIVMS